jgi:plasmid replication initiation protein
MFLFEFRESLHNLIMIEEERKRIHLRQRHNIEGSYSKHVFRIAKEYGDFSDRPFTRIKSIVKVKQVEGYPRIELFAPQR